MALTDRCPGTFCGYFGTPPVSGQRHPGLDQSGLGDPVQRFYMMGLAESTHKVYACVV